MKIGKILGIVSISIFSLLLLVFFLIKLGIVWELSPDKEIYSVKGLDISNHQGQINWMIVPKEYKFIFIKATEGSDFVDKRFYSNLMGSKEMGHLVGAYHFFHFNYSGSIQAKNYIDTVQKYVNLPPVVDIEFDGNPKKYDITKIRAELKIMLSMLKQYYQVDPILYVTQRSYQEIVKGYFDNRIWLRSTILPLTGKEKNVVFWQYTDRAEISGIEGLVDANVFKGNINQLEELFLID